MRDKIKAYEEQAQAIEPNAEQRRALRDAIVNYTEQFLENIHDLEKIPAFRVNDTGVDLTKQPIADEPIDLEKAIGLVAKNVDNEGLNPASGGHFGYIPGGGIYSSSLGDYWADVTNRYAGVFFANSGAVRMENHLINWMKEFIGYPQSALGNLASGGSIANLTAIVAARDAAGIRAENISKQVIYLSKQAHHCINKAINIAGLRECQVRHIALDDRFRMDMEALKKAIEADLEAGLNPWLLVGSAGTTDTGAVDPLDSMADIAQKHGLWFHVDAAYGGFFMLTDYGKKHFRGTEKSDSLVMDPHKGLFLPYGIGVVIVRDGSALRNSFAYEASYMQDTVNLADEVSPADVSPELTKPFRGLRMWLPLMIHGVKPFRAALDEKLLLTRYLYQQLQQIPQIVLGPEPELTVITFRFVPDGGDANQFNQEMARKIHEDGRIFLSTTTIDGIYTLRFAILAFRAHLESINLALSILKEKYEEVAGQAEFLRRY